MFFGSLKSDRYAVRPPVSSRFSTWRRQSAVLQTVRTKLHRSEYSADATDNSSGSAQIPAIKVEQVSQQKHFKAEYTLQVSGGPLPALDLPHDFSNEANRKWSSTIQTGLDNAAAVVSSVSNNVSATTKSTAEASFPAVVESGDTVPRCLFKRHSSRSDTLPQSRKERKSLGTQTETRVAIQGRAGAS